MLVLMYKLLTLGAVMAGMGQRPFPPDLGWVILVGRQSPPGCRLAGRQPVQDSDTHPAGTCCCCTGDVPLASGPSHTSLLCRAANIPFGRNLTLGNAGQDPL